MPDVIICANFGVYKLRGLKYTEKLNVVIFHWNGWSALQQCCATAQLV